MNFVFLLLQIVLLTLLASLVEAFVVFPLGQNLMKRVTNQRKFLYPSISSLKNEQIGDIPILDALRFVKNTEFFQNRTDVEIIQELQIMESNHTKINQTELFSLKEYLGRSKIRLSTQYLIKLLPLLKNNSYWPLFVNHSTYISKKYYISPHFSPSVLSHIPILIFKPLDFTKNFFHSLEKLLDKKINAMEKRRILLDYPTLLVHSLNKSSDAFAFMCSIFEKSTVDKIISKDYSILLYEPSALKRNFNELVHILDSDSKALEFCSIYPKLLTSSPQLLYQKAIYISKELTNCRPNEIFIKGIEILLTDSLPFIFKKIQAINAIFNQTNDLSGHYQMSISLLPEDNKAIRENDSISKKSRKKLISLHQIKSLLSDKAPVIDNSPNNNIVKSNPEQIWNFNQREILFDKELTQVEKAKLLAKAFEKNNELDFSNHETENSALVEKPVDSSDQTKNQTHHKEMEAINSTEQFHNLPVDSYTTNIDVSPIILRNYRMFCTNYPFFIKRLNVWIEAYDPYISSAILLSKGSIIRKPPEPFRQSVKYLYDLIAVLLIEERKRQIELNPDLIIPMFTQKQIADYIKEVCHGTKIIYLSPQEIDEKLLEFQNYGIYPKTVLLDLPKLFHSQFPKSLSRMAFWYQFSLNTPQENNPNKQLEENKSFILSKGMLNSFLELKKDLANSLLMTPIAKFVRLYFHCSENKISFDEFPRFLTILEANPSQYMNQMIQSSRTNLNADIQTIQRKYDQYLMKLINRLKLESKDEKSSLFNPDPIPELKHPFFQFDQNDEEDVDDSIDESIINNSNENKSSIKNLNFSKLEFELTNILNHILNRNANIPEVLALSSTLWNLIKEEYFSISS